MPRLEVSRRGRDMECTPIIALENRRMQLGREGRDIVNFAGGEMDLPTPGPIVEAGVEALRAGYTRYTEDAGLIELREALCRKLARENGLDCSPEDVLITPGSKFALYAALHVLCDPGDEVVIPAPFWPTYREQVLLAGAEPEIVSTLKENAFKLTRGELAASVGPRTRALILNNPCNPTGAVYTREELEALAEAALGEGLFVIVDEIYEHLVFEGPGHVSLASLGEDVRSRTITVGGCSKSFAMTGWRVGFAAGPLRVIAAMKALQSQVVSCANAAAQKAAAAALSAGPVTNFRETLRTRRDTLMAALKTLPGFFPLLPAAGFYVFVDVHPILDRFRERGGREGEGKFPAGSACLADALLEEASVALLPGSAFGAEGYLRLTFAPTPPPRIEEGVRRLRAFFAKSGVRRG